MRKHKDAHILVNKRESDESSEYEGRIPGKLNASKRVFSTLDSNLTDAGYTSAAIGLLERIRKGRERAPEIQHRRDWHLHRENVSQHLKQSSSNMRFGIYKHVSLLLVMKKNSILQAPDAHLS